MSEQHKRDFEQQAAMNRRTPTYWLIEKGSPAKWWRTNHRVKGNDYYSGEWTGDYELATKYSHKDYAEAEMQNLINLTGQGPLTVTEHMNMINPAPEIEIKRLVEWLQAHLRLVHSEFGIACDPTLEDKLSVDGSMSEYELALIGPPLSGQEALTMLNAIRATLCATK